MIFTAPVAYNAADNYALLSLGEVMTMKLVEKLREEKGGVYGVGAYGNLARVPYSYSTFTISFPCAPENADTLSKTALEELRNIMSSGVPAEDIEKIKEQQKRKLEVEIKQNISWKNNLFDAYYSGNDPGNIMGQKRSHRILDVDFFH